MQSRPVHELFEALQLLETVDLEVVRLSCLKARKQLPCLQYLLTFVTRVAKKRRYCGSRYCATNIADIAVFVFDSNISLIYKLYRVPKRVGSGGLHLSDSEWIRKR